MYIANNDDLTELWKSTEGFWWKCQILNSVQASYLYNLKIGILLLIKDFYDNFKPRFFFLRKLKTKKLLTKNVNQSQSVSR